MRFRPIGTEQVIVIASARRSGDPIAGSSRPPPGGLDTGAEQPARLR